jgi:hypothetical protein
LKLPEVLPEFHRPGLQGAALLHPQTDRVKYAAALFEEKGNGYCDQYTPK